MSETVQFIRSLSQSMLPPGAWQTDWSVRRDRLSVRAAHLARGLVGTPVPHGWESIEVAPLPPEDFTAGLRDDLYAERVRVAKSADFLSRTMLDLIERLLSENEAFLDFARIQWGVVHPLAWHAPWSVRSLGDALGLIMRAEALWGSEHTVAVIRPATPDGYQAWSGIGSHMTLIGRFPDLASAELGAIAGVRSNREDTLVRIRAILNGWPNSTPFLTATLGTVVETPLQIRRGPISNQDLDDVPKHLRSLLGLPVVAEVEHGRVVRRYDDRISWDDDISRRRQNERFRDGEARARALRCAAAEDLARNPTLAPLVDTGRGLIAQVSMTLRNGSRITTKGPLSMRDDRACGLALIEDAKGQLSWMAIGEFV